LVKWKNDQESLGFLLPLNDSLLGVVVLEAVTVDKQVIWIRRNCFGVEFFHKLDAAVLLVIVEWSVCDIGVANEFSYLAS